MTSAQPGLRPRYPIRTERLDLRPHRLDDLDDLAAFHSRPEVVRYIPWPVRDRAQTAAALEVKLGQAELSEPGQWLVLAAELRESAAVIGEVLLKWTSRSDRQGELGFAFNSDFYGRGLAHEAATAVLNLGFDELKLHRIEAVCVVGNTASTRLLERLGMRQEARLSHSAFFKGEWVDQFVYAMRADEWRVAQDRSEIAGIVRTFFAAFTSGPDSTARLDALREAFVPEAVIVRTCGLTPAVYDVDGFIAPRQRMLTDGTLSDFREWELSGHTEIFGDIAQHFGSYAKAGVQDGKAFTGRGMKSLQFVRTAAGWRISAAAWDDERDGLLVPASELHQ